MTIKDLWKRYHRKYLRYKRGERQTMPRWYDEVFGPVVEVLRAQYPEQDAKQYGPFGLGSQVVIECGDIGSVTVRPLDLDKGLFGVVDYETNTGEYRAGTIGAMNGFNHPDIPIAPDLDILAFANLLS